MAVQAGSFFFDSRPVTRACREVLTALEPLAPDGVTAHTEPGVVMAHGALHVWTAERECPQLARSEAGLVATWDGRLDNRSDLSIRLGDSAVTGDAAIALALFERSGLDGLRSLIGDWSLVIWDHNRRTIHLARDYMGVRPLYYYADDRQVMWSSSLGELAERTGRADALDERFIAGFMTVRFSTDVTPYRGIRAVPAAACLSLSARHAERKERFWNPEPNLIRYRSRRSYEDHLHHLWTESVGSRLRTMQTVWAELSGGLDSSSVVCMAASLVKDGRVSATSIQPFSHVTVHSPEGDERRFIAEVEACTGTRSEIVGAEEHEDAEDDEWGWVTPCWSYGVGLASLRRVSARGGRLVLSGRVGDLVMGCDPENFVAAFDDITDGRFMRALANVRLWSRACRRPYIEIAAGLFREAWRTRVAGAAPAALTEGQREGLMLLTPNLQNTHEDHFRSVRERPDVRASKRRLASSLLAYPLDGLLNIPGVPHDIIYAHPFTHRPLVEYVLAIPGGELSAPGETRSLMRRAFTGFVPDRILRRTSKGYYPPAAARAARERASSLLPVRQLEVVQRGWLDASRLEAAVHMLLDGSGRSGADVRRVLRLERWLASRARRRTAGIHQRKEVTSHEVLNT